MLIIIIIVIPLSQWYDVPLFGLPHFVALVSATVAAAAALSFNFLWLSLGVVAQPEAVFRSPMHFIWATVPASLSRRPFNRPWWPFPSLFLSASFDGLDNLCNALLTAVVVGVAFGPWQWFITSVCEVPLPLAFVVVATTAVADTALVLLLLSCIAAMLLLLLLFVLDVPFFNGFFGGIGGGIDLFITLLLFRSLFVTVALPPPPPPPLFVREYCLIVACGTPSVFMPLFNFSDVSEFGFRIIVVISRIWDISTPLSVLIGWPSRIAHWMMMLMCCEFFFSRSRQANLIEMNDCETECEWIVCACKRVNECVCSVMKGKHEKYISSRELLWCYE